MRRILRSSLNLVKKKKVKVFSDNKNVKSILSKGSGKLDLNRVALDIHEFSVDSDMTLIPEWIPRRLNDRADSLSKWSDCDDWHICKDIFKC